MNILMKILKTLTDVELAMNELQSTRAQLAAEEAEANSRIAKIRAAITPQITSLEETAIRLENQIVTWAEENRKDKELFPDGRKTLDLHAGIISFRTGAQSVTIVKGLDDSDVVEAIQNTGLKGALKTPDPTLDKTAIKKMYNLGKLDDDDLKKLGLKITQSDSTHIDLKTFDKYATA